MKTTDKPQTTHTMPDPNKKPVDRSPENNLREALKLCRQARAKLVTKGDELMGDKVKGVIEQIADILDPSKGTA